MKITKRQLQRIIREARAKVPNDMTDAKLDAELAKGTPKDFGPRGISTIPVKSKPNKLKGPYRTGSSWETGWDAPGRNFSEKHPISGFYHPLQSYADATIGPKYKGFNRTAIADYEVQPGGPGGKWVMTFVWRDRYGRRSDEDSTPIKYTENIKDTGDWNIWAAKDGIGDAIIRHLVDLGEIPPERLEKLEKYWSNSNAKPSPHGKPRGAEPAGGMAESAFRVSKRKLQRIIREEARKLISESESYVYRTRSGQLRISDDEGNDEPYPDGESMYGHLQPGQGETVLGGGYGYGSYSSGQRRRRRRY